MAYDCKYPVLELAGKPSSLRNMSVFQAFASIAPGCSFEFSSDNEAQDIYSGLEYLHPGEFIWKVVAHQPGTWRILLTKKAIGKSLQ
jgi:uncharacterized protein (DUF2249 family)